MLIEQTLSHEIGQFCASRQTRLHILINSNPFDYPVEVLFSSHHDGCPLPLKRPPKPFLNATLVSNQGTMDGYLLAFIINFEHTKMKHSQGGRTLPHELAPKGMHQKDPWDKSKDLLHVRLDNIQA
jgi:hypothetical protein